MVEDKNSRCRNWSVVIYEDSAPTAWREYLDDLHIEWIESPWHDKDMNADGSPKKKHKHLGLCCGGVKSYEQICELVEPLHCPIPQRIHNLRAFTRYLSHMDNPEKAQYDPKEVVAHGGLDITELLRPCSSMRYTIIGEMLQYVKDNCIIEFQDLVDYAQNEMQDTWFPLLCDNSAYIVNLYINSQRNRGQRQDIKAVPDSL